MPRLTVDGVNFGNVLACARCGRMPKVTTGYEGHGNDGPFVFQCRCDTTEEQMRAHFDFFGDPREKPRVTWQLYRSWSKTRAVRGWNGMQRNIRERAA